MGINRKHCNLFIAIPLSIIPIDFINTAAFNDMQIKHKASPYLRSTTYTLLVEAQFMFLLRAVV